MNPQTLAAELDRDPFIPLRIHLSNGQSVDIQSPGLCHIARLALYFFRPHAPRSTLAADVQVISLRHILSVETVQQ